MRKSKSDYNRSKLKGLGVGLKNKKVFLFYYSPKENNFRLATSSDGFDFQLSGKRPVIINQAGKKEKPELCQNFQFAKLDKGYFLTYKIRSGKQYSLSGAFSKDLLNWEKRGKISSLKETGAVVPNYQYQGQYVMYFGKKTISLAFSKELKKWKSIKEPVLQPREGFFDHSPLEVEHVMSTDKGILLIYHSREKKNGFSRYKVGAALFDKHNPRKLLWRANKAIWEQTEEWQGKRINPIGIVNLNGRLISYWNVEGEGISAVVYSLFRKSRGLKTKEISLTLEKSEANPIISPKKESHWESVATFNPAIIYENGKVHIIYRAMGHKCVSVLGYATSKDGVHIDERLEEPIYVPREPFESPDESTPLSVTQAYMSGGGYGGCEDPKITKIDDKFYMTYVAYNGRNLPRLALTSIPVDDFHNRSWNWEKPVLISPPGVVDKSGCILSERIKGKYVIFHRIFPNILIDFVDDLNFDGETKWLKGEFAIKPRKTMWDSRKISAGAPPIKTKEGWLLIYHAVGNHDPSRYKIGAMLLDLENPTRVLSRSKSPILEPTKRYENEGCKFGIVYPSGAAVIGDQLFVYYGGADMVVCVATANLKEFLADLKYSQLARLEPVTTYKVLQS